jgi:hypothetical protein
MGRLAGSRSKLPPGNEIHPPGTGSPGVVGEVTGRRQVSVNAASGEAVALAAGVVLAVTVASGVCTLPPDTLLHPVATRTTREQSSAFLAMGITGFNAERGF